ncbi:unnamed protein product [Allacma fusca]|uniref:Uncharacterized protein n=1 Tax=Allacma fusca TaxID=39272 RepID=A0A8J2JW89_9HEXA|nr:unnamed protein product [Allacma fusca]
MNENNENSLAVPVNGDETQTIPASTANVADGSVLSVNDNGRDQMTDGNSSHELHGQSCEECAIPSCSLQREEFNPSAPPNTPGN